MSFLADEKSPGETRVLLFDDFIFFSLYSLSKSFVSLESWQKNTLNTTAKERPHWTGIRTCSRQAFSKWHELPRRWRRRMLLDDRSQRESKRGCSKWGSGKTDRKETTRTRFQEKWPAPEEDWPEAELKKGGTLRSTLPLSRSCGGSRVRTEKVDSDWRWKGIYLRRLVVA